jgi:hypothetical protein
MERYDPRHRQLGTARTMLRTLIRWMGYGLLAAAMALGVLDGARSISVSSFEATPLGAAALWLLPRHFPLLEPAVTRHLHPVLWDPVLLNLLLLPAAAAAFGLGGLLLALGRPARPSAIGPV